MNQPRQGGIAIITVLLVVALVAIIASNMTGRLQLIANRTINQQLYQQGLWSAIAGEQLIYKVLEQDYQDSKNSVHLQQLWAREGVVVPLDEGMLELTVQDLHSCFNLNVLANEPSGGGGKQYAVTPEQQQFAALLTALEIEPYLVEQLSSTVRDWIDSNTIVESSMGAEDDNYGSKQVPYLTANAPMATVTELMAIEGMTPALYRKIRPFVCVIPSQTEMAINVNTIAVEQAAVLVAMFGDKLTLSLSDAKSLLGSRNEQGFSNIKDFFASSEIKKLGKLPTDLQKQFKITSDSFRAEMTFTIDQRRFTLTSVFLRDDKGTLAVVSRQFGDIE
ncbi:MAG: type II secretion system minor pseudopilin GspK [Gammaproteobacteria bacterium]|nr:type II secretion system minor pseudopilin GspK [Gammaproteobacteria bacterium]